MDQAELLALIEPALGVSSLALLGRYGQKTVYRCDIGGVPAVTKVVELPIGPDLHHVLERAEREVEALAAVSCAKVVRVLSEAVQIVDGGGAVVAVAWVEEYLDGEDMRLALTAPWDPAEVIALLGDMSEGLAALHELDIVHRDLSPGNVRKRPDGSFTLMDPGLARYLLKTALTGVYQPGTPGFRSPEHTPGGDVQPASDIYCLGILAFAALTNQLPIDPGGSEDDYFRRLRADDPPPVQSVRTGVPDHLAAIVDKCLERQPARRFLDAAELRAALAEAGFIPDTAGGAE